jgi:hypothetical protein
MTDVVKNSSHKLIPMIRIVRTLLSTRPRSAQRRLFSESPGILVYEYPGTPDPEIAACDDSRRAIPFAFRPAENSCLDCDSIFTFEMVREEVLFHE